MPKKPAPKKVNWKRKPFAAGHYVKRNQKYRYLSLSYKTFLLLVSIHTSIFLVPRFPIVSIILLLSLIKGWSIAG